MGRPCCGPARRLQGRQRVEKPLGRRWSRGRQSGAGEPARVGPRLRGEVS